MRQVLVAVGAVLVLAGCGVDTTAEPASTLPDPTTTVATESRADVGRRIVETFDPDGTAPYMQANPEAVAEMAGQYCADLETNRAQADAALERAVQSYLALYSDSTAPDRAQQTAAGLMANVVGEAAVEQLCPELGSDKYLPDN